MKTGIHIIAEAACNHNGELELGKRLIDTARRAAEARHPLESVSCSRSVGGGPWGIGGVPLQGDPAWVTKRPEGDARQGLPWPLPGGRTVLYTVARPLLALVEDVVAETLATGARKLLLKNAGDARYVPTGHLAFLREARLFAVPFDAERLEVLGKEVPLLDGVARARTAIRLQVFRLL